MRRAFAVATVSLLLLSYGGVSAVALMQAASSAQMTSGGTLATTSDVEITLAENITIDGNPSINDKTLALPHRGRVSGTGPAHVRVTSWNGTVSVDQIEADGTVVTIDPESRGSFGVGGGIDTADVEPIDIDDQQVDFVYDASSEATIKINGLQSGVAIEAVDGGQRLDAARVDDSGALTLDELPSGTHDATLQVFNPNEPEISDVSPDGTQTIDGPITLAANVSDPDFPDDELNVVWKVDGNTVNETNISASQRVEYPLSNTPDAGLHTWTLEVTDEVGVTTSVTTDLPMPSNVTFRNETAPDNIIGSPITVTGTFAGGDTIDERTTNDGNISLAGLPTDEEIVLSAEAEGYFNRRVYLDSLVKQQNVYLLSENASAVEVEFQIDDSTGSFEPSESIIIIEKPFNTSSGTEYRAVSGGRLGAANSFPTMLEEGETYRIKVRNEQGQTRVLGEYTANQATVETLPIGNVEISDPRDSGWSFNGHILDSDGSQPYLRLVFVDQNQSTTRLSYTVVNETSGENVTSVVETQGLDGYSELVPIGSTDGRYAVNYEIARNGQIITGTIMAGEPKSFIPGMPIDMGWANLIGMVGIVMMGGLTVIRSSVLAAVAMSVFAVAFTLIGLVAIPWPILGLACVTALIWSIAAPGGEAPI